MLIDGNSNISISVGATKTAERIYALGVGIPRPKIIVTKAAKMQIDR